MNILAIDTATQACSVALLQDGVVHEDYREAPQQHAKLLLTMIDAILEKHHCKPEAIDVLAFGRGPGSFTGVRIAASAVQGLALGLNIPVAPISNLQALAHFAQRTLGASAIIPALDARMGEIYWAAYHEDEQGMLQIKHPESVSSADQLSVLPSNNWIGIGNAWHEYSAAMEQALVTPPAKIIANALPHAYDIALLAQQDPQAWLPAEQALPVYLRDNVTHRS